MFLSWIDDKVIVSTSRMPRSTKYSFRLVTSMLGRFKENAKSRKYREVFEVHSRNDSREHRQQYVLIKAFVEGLDLWMMLAWSIAWQYCMNDKNKIVICVKCDQLWRTNVYNGVLKAFITCHHYIDSYKINESIFSCTVVIGSPLESANY